MTFFADETKLGSATVTHQSARKRRVTPSAVARAVVVVSVLVFGGRILWRSVPFVAASYAAWAGIFFAAGALVALLCLPQWLGIRTRKQAGILFVLGVAVTATALLSPSPSTRSSNSKYRIDDFLPQFSWVEYHEARTQASLERVLESLHHVTIEDMPGVPLLLGLRALAGGKLSPPMADPEPLLDSMVQPGSGFLVLDASDAKELVYGIVGRPWTNQPPPPVNTPEEFRALDAPGQIRVAFSFRVEREPAGTIKLSTETRILGNDREAQRSFDRYWRLIYPGSAIIRRVMLDAIIARAERSAP
ncbi:MAG TPA: hypothetical protein VKP30_20530 [Polyangiaceae bacterium]|nr:hypothetical protein [Polyangiaceae bacterium]